MSPKRRKALLHPQLAAVDIGGKEREDGEAERAKVNELETEQSNPAWGREGKDAPFPRELIPWLSQPDFTRRSPASALKGEHLQGCSPLRGAGGFSCEQKMSEK
jgi:hypothetical protein